jgi:hypothetical protein
MGVMPAGRPSKYDDPYYRPQPPVEPLRRLSEALLGCEVKKAANRLTLSFDDPRDSRTAHLVLKGLQDSFEAPRKP